jgi:branched-chain amino acid transport system substrate-binding protein
MRKVTSTSVGNCPPRRLARTLLGGCTAAILLLGLGTASRAEDGVTADTIKIGMFGGLTGPSAPFGKMVLGAEAVYKDVNAKGGINGRKIQIIQEDDSCDPVKALAEVKKLITQDHVFMLHGATCTGVAFAVKPEVTKSDIPWMLLGASADQLVNPVPKDVFMALPSTVDAARFMTDFTMSDKDITKVGIISHSDDWGKSYRDPAVKQLEEKYHLSPVANVTMERGSTDATPQILKLRQSGAQVIWGFLYPVEFSVYLRDAYKYGLRTPILGTGAISLTDMKNRVGNPAALADLYVYYHLAGPVDAPTMKPWRDIWTASFPNEHFEPQSFTSMAGALAVVDALRRAGPDLTRERFVDALNATKDFEPGVLNGPVSFSPTNHNGVKHSAMATFGGTNRSITDEVVVQHEFKPK